MVYGFLHCHSDHSLKDSPNKIKELCKLAKDMGAKAISLTDHGVCTGHIEFMDCCRELGLNGIPGVEAYVETEYAKHAHLLLLPKNYTGYQELSKAVTLANKNLTTIGRIESPVMTKEILTECFGNGNVIATSACVSGVLSAVLLQNNSIQHEIDKVKKKQLKYQISDDISKVEKEYRELSDAVEQLKTEKKRLQELSQKRYKKREKALNALKKDPAVYIAAKKKLEQEIDETEQAKKQLEKVAAELKAKSCCLTARKKKYEKLKETMQSYQEYEQQIIKLKQSIQDMKAIRKQTEEEVLWFVRLFHGDFYIELQYHGLEDEAYVMPILAQIADKFDIPMVATNDVHILYPKDAETRSYLAAMRFERYEPVSDSDRELYLKNDKKLSEKLREILPEDTVQKAMDNIKTICDSCKVVIPRVPEVHHYPVYKDASGKSSDILLRELAYAGLHNKISDITTEYRKRLEYELDTIIEMGFADYILIVADYVKKGKEIARDNNEKSGYGVGPGRGSGAGSLVNYCLGITALDPIKYGLLFERFLNKERVSMPDIDVDFSDEVREPLIAYVKEKYGEESVACIRTVMIQKAKACIRNTARILGFERYPDSLPDFETGRKKLRDIGDRLCKSMKDEDSLDYHKLVTKCPEPEAKEIVKRALLMENTNTSFSAHAAGIIIGDGNPLYKYIPLFYNTSKQQWVVSCNMTEAEDIGLLKMDFLCLNNLDVISECIRRIKRNTGIVIDPEKLPFEKEVFNEIFCKGQTSCVFQFESDGMKKMLRDFLPDSFEDLILLVAAYRPGPMEFIPDIIQVKRGKKKPHYIIPKLEKILSDTYGKCIYQEQLMSVFHECAGFTLGEADIVRRYMSKKKVAKFLAYKPKFIEGIKQEGTSEEEAEVLWSSLEDFAKYAFNRSHAAVYALISYQTAWLKYHYPAEYMCAVLNHTAVERIPVVIHECKRMGLSVFPPDINRTGEKFNDCQIGIIYGLGMIKGMKDSDAHSIIEERHNNGKYRSVQEFLMRTKVTEAVYEKLIVGGCFLNFCKNREKMVETSKKILHIRDNILKNRNKENSRKDSILYGLNREYDSILDTQENESDPMIWMNKEKELLGDYISSNPMDAYSFLKNSPSIHPLSEIVSNGYYAGVITQLEIKEQKDGREMAVLRLEDWEGMIECVCFSKTYELYKELLKEGNVIKIEAVKNTWNDSENLIINKVFQCKKYKKSIFIGFEDRCAWNSIRNVLLAHEDPDGHPLILYQKDNSSLWEHVRYNGKELFVNKNILDEPIPGASFQQMLFF